MPNTKKNSLLITFIKILGVIVLLPIGLSSYCYADDKATLTKQQLKEVNKEIFQLKNELGKDISFQKKEQETLKNIETELGVLHKKSRELNQQKIIINKKITKLKNQEQTLIRQNKQQKKALNKDLQALYKIGKQEKLKLLLNQENPEDLARTLKYYDYYTDARVQRIRNYQKNINSIELKRLEIEKELAALQLLQEEINEKASKLKEHQLTRKEVLAGINKTILSKDQQLKELQNNQTQLSKLLRSLQGIWADIPRKLSKAAFKKRKGKLNYPVKGRIKHSFGSQRVGGRMKWNGWLIEASLNTNVQALHDGRIVFSDWIRGYGLLIIVDHSDGYLSLYGHNASILKETGDWIQSGETLATVGNSGGQHETGLYFELRHDGKPLNPKYWLKK